MFEHTPIKMKREWFPSWLDKICLMFVRAAIGYEWDDSARIGHYIKYKKLGNRYYVLKEWTEVRI